MVESRRRAPRQEQSGQQKNPLGNIVERTDLNADQSRAATIIRRLELSSEQKDLLFLYYLFHESGSVSGIKKFTGLKNNRDASVLIGKVMDSDDLVDKYKSFYTEYRLDDKSEE